MDLRWLDPEQPDEGDIAGAVAMWEAARRVDAPDYPFIPMVSWLTATLRHGWDGDPPLMAVTRDRRGRVVGLLRVWPSNWDNRHLAEVYPVVDPAARRQGLGRRLFEVGVDRVRADGRTVVLSESYDDPGPIAFAKAMGMDRASEAVNRRQHLVGLDWARLDREYEAAAAHATGYELLRIPGAIPDELMPDVVRMTEAINDAPTDDLDIEDEVFSPERLRAFEAAHESYRRRLYRVVARERATGVLAGHTLVAIVSERPAHAMQYDTSVLRAHRGHRLGLLLKIEMLRWLAEREPQLRTLDTDNAASNAHMIHVNEVLGYQVVGKTIEWQRHL